MSKLEQELIVLKFERVGAILRHLSGHYPFFEIKDPVTKRYGFVYMWVLEKNKKPHAILYIGRAGRSVKERCAQHFGGFKGGSNSGIRNAKIILKELKVSGFSIGVYARYSKQTTILDQENISLSHAEEVALILRYNGEYKLLNVAC